MVAFGQIIERLNEALESAQRSPYSHVPALSLPVNP
jgi:hypothetical protein